MIRVIRLGIYVIGVLRALDSSGPRFHDVRKASRFIASIAAMNPTAAVIACGRRDPARRRRRRPPDVRPRPGVVWISSSRSISVCREERSVGVWRSHKTRRR